MDGKLTDMQQRALNWLTEEERALLGPHLAALDRLARGATQPKTPAQGHFVSVSEGYDPPQTPYEHAYLAYRRAYSTVLAEHRQAVRRLVLRRPGKQRRPAPDPAAAAREAEYERRQEETRRKAEREQAEWEEQARRDKERARERSQEIKAQDEARRRRDAEEAASRATAAAEGPVNTLPDIPEFEEGSPRPGFVPLGKFQ